MTTLKFLFNAFCSPLARLFLRISILFINHEAWVLRVAKAAPILSLFVVATLWIWIVIPVLLITPLTLYLLFNTEVVGGIVNLVIGGCFLTIIAPWFFRWYFVCLNLMFRQNVLAQKKGYDIEYYNKLLRKKLADYSVGK